METKTEQAVELSTQDVEAAVRYLAGEEARRQEERRRFRMTVIAITAAGIMTYVCLLGLVVVWFNRTLGFVLLGLAALSMAVFTVINFSKGGKNAFEDGFRMFSRGTKSSASTGQQPRRYVLGMMVAGLAFFSCLGGFGWMLYGLFTHGELGLPSVGLIVASIVIASIAMGLYAASVQRYNARVSSLREELESHLETADAEEAEPRVVTAQDLIVLARAERAQLRVELEEAVQESSDETAEGWYVYFPEQARSDIRALPDAEQFVVRDAIDNLQIDPRPPEAQPGTVGEQPAFWIELEGHRILYALDEAENTITVYTVHGGLGGEEVGDVS